MLKVVCMYKSHGEYHRLLGFGKALASAGHEFVFWYPDKKPLIDVFDELNPDIFIGTTFDLDRALINALRLYPEIKVVLKGGNWGDQDEEIKAKGYPVLFAQEQEIKNLAALKAEIGKPDLVMCHYHPNRVNETMGKWRSIGIEPIGIMNAADICTYGKGKFRQELESDISFVGGYWGYKAANLDRYLVSICGPDSKLNIKVFGNQKWSVPQYCGLIEDSDVKDLYASTKVCVNVSEPHSNDFGFDVVERPFKILSSHGFLLMDRVKSFEEDVFTNNEVNYYGDQKEYLEKLAYFLKNPDKRNNDAAIKKVYAEHTYNHRVAYLLKSLGYEQEAKEVILALCPKS